MSRLFKLSVRLLPFALLLSVATYVPENGSFPMAWLDLRASFKDSWDLRDSLPKQERGPGAGHGRAADESHHKHPEDSPAHGRQAGSEPQRRELPEAQGRPNWATRTPGTHSFDPAKSTRLVERSGPATDFYQNPDGSITVRQSANGRVNFRDSDGKYQPLDLRLVKGTDERVRVRASDMRISFAAPRSDVLGGGQPAARGDVAQADLATLILPSGAQAGYRLLGAAPVSPVIVDNRAFYPDMLPHVDVELIAGENGWKEDLILKDPQAGSAFVFPLRLKGLTPRLSAGGSVEMLDSAGKVALSIPPAFMEDSAPVDASGERIRSDKVSYELIKVEGVPALKVIADKQWLADPARVWPVRLDPTFVGGTGDMADVYVDDEPGTGASAQNGTSLAVGRYINGSVPAHIARSFMAFENFDDDGFRGMRIAGARLALFLTWTSNCNTHLPFWVHRVTSPWSVAGLQTADLNSTPAHTPAIGTLTITDHYPACTNTGGNRSTGEWHWVGLGTETFNDWSTVATGSPWNQGLALTAPEGNYGGSNSGLSWKRFTSANYTGGTCGGVSCRPMLELTFAPNVVPQVNTMFPESGSQVTTLTPQLIADAHDPDVFPSQLKYTFEIFDAADDANQVSLASSGPQTQNVWTVPPGVLKWGGRYRWQVRVTDGALWSFVWDPTWRSVLSTPVPQTLITSKLGPNGGLGFAAGSGNYTTSATDAKVATVGPALAIERHYNSADPRVGVFGAGWSSILDSELVDSGSLVRVTYPTGQEVAFGRNADNSYTAGLGRHSVLKLLSPGPGFTLTDKQGDVYRFTTSLGANRFGLTSVTDVSGNTLTLNWSGGKVNSVVSASGRSLHLTWNGSRVATVKTDPVVTVPAPDPASALTWSYSYSGDNLSAACPPETPSLCTVYGYTPVNLYSSAVRDLEPHSYWRLGEAAGEGKAASAALGRMGTDVGVYNSVTTGVTSGPLAGAPATVASFDGTSSRVTLPSKLVTRGSYQSISMFVKAAPGSGEGVLYGQSLDAVTAASTVAPYHPVLYLGSDGKLVGGYPVNPAPGPLGSMVGHGSGRCFDMSGGGLVNGEIVHLYDCHGGGNQEFTLTAAGELRFTYSGQTRCVDGKAATNGVPAVAWACDGSAGQKWWILANGRIVSQATGKCLDAEGGFTTNGIRVIAWECHDQTTTNQTWSPSQHQTIQSGITVADGQWHHVALVADGNKQTLYIDGVDRGSLNNVEVSDIRPKHQVLGTGYLGGKWPNQSHLSTLSNIAVPDGFTGQMAEVALFDHALEAGHVEQLSGLRSARQLVSTITRPSGGVTAEIAYDALTGQVSEVTDENGGVWELDEPKVSGSSQLYAAATLAELPSDYWRLNDFAGTTVAVNQLNGSLAKYAGTVSFGSPADGAFFDTIAPLFNQQMSVELTTDNVPTTSPTSISMWFQMPSGSTQGGVLFGYMNNTPEAGAASTSWVPAIYVGIDGKLRGQFWHGSANPITTGGTVNDGQWHHVVLSASATSQTMYLDGNAVGTNNTARVATPTADHAYIGTGRWAGTWPSSSGDTGKFPGRIAEVAYYRSQLDANAVNRKYSAAADSLVEGTAQVGVPAQTVSVIDPEDNVISQIFDLRTGQQIASIDALDYVTRYEYHLMSGFLKATVDPEDGRIEYEYDVRGNVIAQSTSESYDGEWWEEDKATSYYTYFPDATTKNPAPDPRNDLLLTSSDGRSADADDTTYQTTLDYDSAGNMVKVTDPLGREMTNTFNAKGQPTKHTSARGSVVETFYLSNGDVDKVIDETGKETRYTYDGIGRMLTQTEITSTFPAGLVSSYKYDKASRIVEVKSPPVLNRVTGNTHTPKTTAAYLPDGLLQSLTTEDLTGGDAPRTTSYEYDGYGRRDAEIDARGKRTEYTYDLYGRIATTEDHLGTVTATDYNPHGQLVERSILNHTGDPDNPTAPTTLQLEYNTYDGAGRIVSSWDAMGWRTDYHRWGNGLIHCIHRVPDDPEQWEYVTEDYHYDKAGNVVYQYTNDYEQERSFTYDAASRATEMVMEEWLGPQRVTAISYTDDDDVASITISDGVTPVAREQAIYDAAGLVLARTTYTAGGLTPVSRWKLDETTGTAVADAAANNLGAATNVSWSADHGGSASLTNGHILSTDPAVDTAASYTVSAWAKLTNTSGDRTVVSADGENISAFLLGYEDSLNRWRMSLCPTDSTGGTCVDAVSTAAPQVGVWTHLTGVVSGSTVKLYVNGVLADTETTATPWASYGPVVIGAGKWGTGTRTGHFAGGIDDVQIYQQELSATEVTSVYNGAATASASRTSYRRDEGGLILSSSDPMGHQTTFEYDSEGRTVLAMAPTVTAEVHGQAPSSAMPITWAGFNTFGEQTHAKDPVGSVMTVGYDAAGNRTSTTFPSYLAPGTSTPVVPQVLYEYDDLNRLKKVTNPAGFETSYVYDQLDHMTRQTNPDTGVVRYSYTANGHVSQVTDPSGAVKQATWDFLGRLKTETTVLRHNSTAPTVNYEYGWDGRVSAVISADGVRTEFTYNFFGELETVTDAAGAQTSYDYDAAGRNTRVSQHNGSFTDTTYDLAGRPTQKQWSDGTNILKTVSAGYDKIGRLTSSTDGRAITKSFGYDAGGRLTSQTEPVAAAENIQSTFGYDLAGRQTRFTNGRGNAFWTTYNTLGRVQDQIEPATAAHPNLADRTFTAKYDVAGRLVGETLPGGVSITHTYNNMSRLTGSSGSGAEAATASRSYGYDTAGRVNSVSGTGGTNTMTWDDRGLLLSVSGPSGTNAFTYTGDGQMQTRQDAAGTTTYGHDTAGRLQTIANPATATQMSLIYNTMSQLERIDHGTNGNRREFGYDPLQRLTTDELKTSAGAQIGKITYGYDENDNLTSKSTIGFAGAASNTYQYDWANRMTSWSNGSATTAYDYDEAGNRTLAGAHSATYDQRNQLLSTSDGTVRQYTARGTLRKETIGTVEMDTLADAFGQITQQETPLGATLNYTYDGLGRLTKAGFAYTGLGNDLASDGTSTYTVDPAGGVLGVKQGASSTYAWTDRHTDVVGYFTATGTTLSGSATYDPWGKTVAAATPTGSLGFQQEYTEAATGKVNMHARWYDPDTGGFDSRDSVTLSATPASANANRHGYGNGGPLNGTDPTGHSFMTMSGCDSVFGCLLQGFVNAFDFIGMVESAWKALKDLKNTISSMINGLKTDAARWSSKISSMINDRVDCSWLFFDKLVNGCKNAIKAAAEIGGWACALSGVCDIIYDCFSSAGNKNSCAEQAGGILADAVMAIITAGAGAVARKVANRIGDLLRKYNLPDNRNNNNNNNGNGNNNNNDELTPEEEKRLMREAAKKKAKDNGNGNVKCTDPKKCKNNKGNGGGGGKKGGNGGGGSNKIDPNAPRNLPAAKDLIKGLDSNSKGCPTVSKNGHSFDPATPVLMADGTTKPIGQIEVGDQVTATDPETGQNSAQQVTVLHEHLDTKLTDVTVSTVGAPGSGGVATGEGHGDRSTRGPTETVLHTTQNHPFWDATADAWVNAADLKPGVSTLTGPSGEIQLVTEVRNFVGAQTMNDLTVAGVHTYYVLAGDSPVLVHNNDPEWGRVNSVTTPLRWTAFRPGVADDVQAWLPVSNFVLNGRKPLMQGEYHFVVMPDWSVRAFHSESVFDAFERAGDPVWPGHTSLSYMRQVIMAGTFDIDQNGEIESYGNRSGHYRPENTPALEQIARKALEDAGFRFSPNALWDCW